MMQVYCLPAFSDNYIFVLVEWDSRSVAVVDAGEPFPVLDFLRSHSLQISMILNTHYDGDHVGANRDLLQAFPGIPVYGSAIDRGRIPGQTVFLTEGDVVRVGAAIGQVLAVPGHRLGHIAYHFAETADLFCGDVLFSGGSGRIKDGTPAQMQQSLAKLRSLPDRTKIWCAHEYTFDNLSFALTIEPENLALQTRMQEVMVLRSQHEPTIPTDLGFEKLTNPFLRWDVSGIRSRLGTSNDLDTYTEIRSRKNRFTG
jgi:hydroxyacylglutathione hydrolase